MCSKLCRKIESDSKSCEVKLANPFKVVYFAHASYFEQKYIVSFFLIFQAP